MRPRSNDDGVDDDARERGRALPLLLRALLKRRSPSVSSRGSHMRNKNLNICREVAKHERVDACRYGGKCHLSHDLIAFLAQKPADLEGCCPFLNDEESCPYGIMCRFLDTHKENCLAENLAPSKKSHEINNLSKDLQRLLWKNKVNFLKADAQLKLLGLKCGNNTKAKPGICQEVHEDNLKGSNDLHVDDRSDKPTGAVNDKECASVTCTEKECLDDTSITDDSRPLKKMKCPIDEPCCPTEAHAPLKLIQRRSLSQKIVWKKFQLIIS